MERQEAVLDTSFWVLGHRIDVLPYLFRFFELWVPEAVCNEVLATDPRYPQRVYGYQEIFRLLEAQGLLTRRDPQQPLGQFHAGEAAALALAREHTAWLLVNEQRALRFARREGIKSVTVPEFAVYLYETRILSHRSAADKLEALASNTGQTVMQAARRALQLAADKRGERI